MNVVKCGAFLTMLYRLMPESLVAVLAISALDTAVTTLIIGPPLRVFTFSRIEAEADLRAALMRAQQYAEEIVLFRGGDRELARCQRQLDGILGIQRSRRDWDAGCGVYRGLVDWVTNLVPTLLIAPAYTHVLECARLARDDANPAAALREWRFRALHTPVTRV